MGAHGPSGHPAAGSALLGRSRAYRESTSRGPHHLVGPSRACQQAAINRSRWIGHLATVQLSKLCTPTPTRSRDVGGVTALPHIRTLRCFVPPQRTYVDANPIGMPQHSGTAAPPRWGGRYLRPRQKVSGPCATSTVPVDVQSWRSSSFCTRSPQDRRRHIRTGTGGLLGRPGRQPSRHRRLSVEWHESSSARRRSRLAWSELTVQSATHVGTFY